MKKKLIFIVIPLILLLISNTSNVYAQKKGVETETTINVNYPVLSYEYIEGTDDDGNPLGKVDLQIYDRKGQSNDFSYYEMNAKSRNNQPIKGQIKVIFYEELGGFNFRFTETMEERKRTPDGTTCLLLDETKLLPAHRVKFSNQ
jgi:hypothetical protein